jgi:hypothetical protein
MSETNSAVESTPFEADSTAAVEKPKRERKPRKTRKDCKAPVRKGLKRGELLRATAFAGLAGAGLTVSLPHLASEVGSLTGASTAAAWFTAIVIDLGLCASKAHLSARGPKAGVAWSVVVVCMSCPSASTATPSSSTLRGRLLRPQPSGSAASSRCSWSP